MSQLKVSGIFCFQIKINIVCLCEKLKVLLENSYFNGKFVLITSDGEAALIQINLKIATYGKITQ